MFTIKTVLRLVLIVLALSGLTLLTAIDRPEFRRLINMHSEWNSQMSQSMDYMFFYNAESPAVVDSVYINDSAPANGIHWYTHLYNGTVTYMEAGTKYEYFIDHADYQIPVYHVYYILDELGRSVEESTESWSSYYQSYRGRRTLYRHYNDAGYADSLHYIDNVNYHYYTKRSFEGSMLTSSISYKNGPDNWIPDLKFLYSYAMYPEELDAHIRFDCMNYSGNIIKSYMYEQFANSKFIPSTITARRWNAGSSMWVSDAYTYTQTLVNNQVKLHRFYNSPSESYTDYINADRQGNVMRILSAWNYDLDGGSGQTDFTWDIVVANDDETAPEITGKLLCFPNPFDQDLKVRILSKSAEPVEVVIYNLRGQQIRKLQGSGGQELIWDGKDMADDPVSPGIYLLKMTQGSQISNSKVMRY